MQKTLFKKYLRITSLVILISFLILSLVMLIFTSNYWQGERRGMLRKSAENVARIASSNAVVISPGHYLLGEERMRSFMTAFADNIDSDIFVTDSSGQILASAYGSGGNVDATRHVDSSIMRKALDNHYGTRGTLGGVYSEPYYIVGVPIVTQSGETLGAVFAAYNVASFNLFRVDLMKIFFYTMLAAFLVSFCVVWIFSYRLVQPLRIMATAAHCFGEGNFSVRVPVTSQDEIGQLAVAFNSMANSLASGENVRRNFIANVSHELKTPMTTIAGFIDGILDGTIPPEKQKHYLGIVSQEVKRLSRLVRTMLDLSRIDSGEMKLRPARFDLTNTVLVALLSFEDAIDAKKMEVRGLEDTDSVFVDGDPDMIHQVVYNLIDNAVKFTNPGGYLEIRIRPDEGRTVVSIENSGAGIAPDELPLIFERFYKTDKSRSQDKNGMGLGLYIVKTIIQLHGGEIRAESVVNQYCRFVFWLPKKIEQPRDGQHRLVETSGKEKEPSDRSAG